MTKPTLLIDGDIVLHRVLASQETDVDWGDGVSTIFSDHAECKRHIRRTIRKWCEKFDTKSYRLALSGSANFRKDLDPDYKGNRTGRKPVGWKPLKDWLFSQGNTRTLGGVEADDLLGIWATHGVIQNTIIISDDKDLRSIPGKLYVPRLDEVIDISVEEADQYHMEQTLTGDRTDNYKGCPGFGEKKSAALFAKAEGPLWPLIVKCFEKAGLTEDDALLQARLARILRFEDYDMVNKKPILWSPK